MAPDKLEHLEKTAMAMVVQAIKDYSNEAATIFREESDLPQDIAEDVTREALESMGFPGLPDRLYGKVDVKKAIYVFLPETETVALMVDAKAEKPDGKRTATIQMSQTSMIVKMRRRGENVEEPGKLDTKIHRGARDFSVVTIIVKYIYAEDTSRHARELEQIIIACIPSGALQEYYNPTAENTIWLAGRDAPTRGEDFRVRLSFSKLKNKADWRVATVIPGGGTNFQDEDVPPLA